MKRLQSRINTVIVLWIFVLVAGSATFAFQKPAGQGSARIEKPFKRQVNGAECYSGAGKYAGLVAFGFPNRATRALAFSIGPLKDALSPGQENNKPYSGPGEYKNIGIAGKSEMGRCSSASAASRSMRMSKVEHLSPITAAPQERGTADTNSQEPEIAVAVFDSLE